MRTTLTLDDDVAARLREQAERTGQPFRQVVNDTLRAGLQASAAAEPREPYRTQPMSLGLMPGINYDKAMQLADELEDEAFFEKNPDLDRRRRG